MGNILKIQERLLIQKFFLQILLLFQISSNTLYSFFEISSPMIAMNYIIICVMIARGTPRPTYLYNKKTRICLNKFPWPQIKLYIFSPSKHMQLLSLKNSIILYTGETTNIFFFFFFFRNSRSFLFIYL